MEIKILYDNKSAKPDIVSGWGFSCLVGGSVLFDAGEDGNSLLENMKTMKVDISNIKNIVISHDHWDHVGGLELVLKKKKGIKVHGCAGFSREFKNIVNKYDAELVETDLFSNITSNIFTTGAIKGTYKGGKIDEQSLVIKTTKGITIVTGCAHPGIVKIVEHIKGLLIQEKFYCVLGGFHLKKMSNDEVVSVCDRLMDLGVQKAGPTHCSGEVAANIFKKKFRENYMTIASGKDFDV
jgi:7,8-dihydropterin-6-yl-methyl-4-(beta-D-ribofuranosyl)aminobenzene 5'-phosphate synthase